MEKGDFVRIDFVGRLEGGEIFDLTDEELAKKEKIYSPKIKYKPVALVVGAKFVIPGLDKAILEMKIGEKKKIEVMPEEGFGNRDPKLVKVAPKKAFNEEPRQGMIVDFSGMKGRIQSVSAGRVMVDFNNPLAGKKLIYELQVKEKIEEPIEQIKSIFEFFGIEKIDIKLVDKGIDVEAANMASELKKKISSLVMEHVRPDAQDIEKVRFIETYEKPK